MVVLPQKHLLSIFSKPLLFYCNFPNFHRSGKNYLKQRAVTWSAGHCPAWFRCTRPWRWLFVTQARGISTRWTLALLLPSCICLFRGEKEKEKKKAWGFARTKLSPNVQSEITQIPRNSYKKYVSRSIWMKHFDKPPSNANSPRSVLESVHCCWVCGSEPKGTIWG